VAVAVVARTADVPLEAYKATTTAATATPFGWPRRRRGHGYPRGRSPLEARGATTSPRPRPLAPLPRHSSPHSSRIALLQVCIDGHSGCPARHGMGLCSARPGGHGPARPIRCSGPCRASPRAAPTAQARPCAGPGRPNGLTGLACPCQPKAPNSPRLKKYKFILVFSQITSEQLSSQLHLSTMSQSSSEEKWIRTQECKHLTETLAT
jgi:hypothetical protein